MSFWCIQTSTDRLHGFCSLYSLLLMSVNNNQFLNCWKSIFICHGLLWFQRIYSIILGKAQHQHICALLNNSFLSPFFVSHLINNLISQFAVTIFQWPLFKKITSNTYCVLLLHTWKLSPLKYIWILSDCYLKFLTGWKREKKVFNPHRRDCFIYILWNVFDIIWPKGLRALRHREHAQVKQRTKPQYFMCSAPAECI